MLRNDAPIIAATLICSGHFRLVPLVLSEDGGHSELLADVPEELLARPLVELQAELPAYGVELLGVLAV